MLFFKSRQAPQEKLSSWSILRWARTPHDYIPWEFFDFSRSLEPYFRQSLHALAEYEGEWSIITHSSELKPIIQVLTQKTDTIPLAKNTKINLKIAPFGNLLFKVTPFVYSPTPLPFSPPNERSLDLILQIAFFEQNQIESEFEKKRQFWLEKIDFDRIDAFSLHSLKAWLNKALIQSTTSMSFESLKNIFDQFEQEIYDKDKQVSQEYLKKNWMIPSFIFINRPEEGALTRLRLQKSAKNVQRQVQEWFVATYKEQLLRWMLYKPFDEAEKRALKSLLIDQPNAEVFLEKELFTLYQQLLNRCGIPVELSDLYGTDLFVERVLKTLEAVSSKTSQINIVMIEDTIRFLMHHTTEVLTSADELVYQLVKIMIQRVGTFHHLQQEIDHDSLKNL